jgi:hypothetical protein
VIRSSHMFTYLYANPNQGVNPAGSGDPVHVWVAWLFVLDDPSVPARA